MNRSTTVGDVIKRLRKMWGHLSAKDRAVVLEAIEAICELSQRLHEATHVAPKKAESLSAEKVEIA